MKQKGKQQSTPTSRNLQPQIIVFVFSVRDGLVYQPIHAQD